MIALSCAGLVVVFVYDARHGDPYGRNVGSDWVLIVANGSTDVASGAFTHRLLHTATVTHGLSALAVFCFSLHSVTYQMKRGWDTVMHS